MQPYQLSLFSPEADNELRKTLPPVIIEQARGAPQYCKDMVCAACGSKRVVTEYPYEKVVSVKGSPMMFIYRYDTDTYPAYSGCY